MALMPIVVGRDCRLSGLFKLDLSDGQKAGPGTIYYLHKPSDLRADNSCVGKAYEVHENIVDLTLGILATCRCFLLHVRRIIVISILTLYAIASTRFSCGFFSIGI